MEGKVLKGRYSQGTSKKILVLKSHVKTVAAKIRRTLKDNIRIDPSVDYIELL